MTVRRFYDGTLVEVIAQVGKMMRVYVLEGRAAGRYWIVDPKKLQKGTDLFLEKAKTKTPSADAD